MITFKTKPYDHQRDEFNLSKDMATRGLFWEMGTGKTKPLIDTAAHLYDAKEISGLVVIAPNGVHRNWVTDELPLHMPSEIAERAEVMYWRTSKAKTKWHGAEAEAVIKHGGFPIVCASYPAIMTEPAAKYLARFVRQHRCMGVLDESPYIKTPGAKRTKRIMAMGKHFPYRRIATGTLVDDKPFDVFTQLKFLDDEAWNSLGCSTFAAFKATFGVWRTGTTREGREFPQLVNFRNLHMLTDIVAKYGSRLLKDDVLDLPPKVYTKRYFDMTPKQWKAYRDLRDDLLTWIDGQPIMADLAIVMRMRLQQITSGYLPTEDPESEELVMTPLFPANENPRIKLLLEVLEEVGDTQVIVWAKYKEDINQILDQLRRADISCVRYDGQCNETEAGEAVDSFKAGNAQVFVGNPAKGAEGITMVCAKTVVYYNNTYKLSKRLQSEDRAHRIGQTDKVLYVDLCASDTVDLDIIDALVNKFEMAAIVQGDQLRNWI